MGSTGKLAASSDLDRSLTFGDVAGVDQAKRQVQVLTSSTLYLAGGTNAHAFVTEVTV